MDGGRKRVLFGDKSTWPIIDSTGKRVWKCWFIQSRTPNLWMQANEWEVDLLHMLRDEAEKDPVPKKKTFYFGSADVTSDLKAIYNQREHKDKNAYSLANYSGYFVWTPGNITEIDKGYLMYDDNWIPSIDEEDVIIQVHERVKRKCIWRLIEAFHDGAILLTDDDFREELEVYENARTMEQNGYGSIGNEEQLTPFNIDPPPFPDSGHYFLQSMVPDQWLHMHEWEETEIRSMHNELKSMNHTIAIRHIKRKENHKIPGQEYECYFVCFRNKEKGTIDTFLYDKEWKKFGSEVEETGEWKKRYVYNISLPSHNGAYRLTGRSEYDDEKDIEMLKKMKEFELNFRQEKGDEMLEDTDNHFSDTIGRLSNRLEKAKKNNNKKKEEKLMGKIEELEIERDNQKENIEYETDQLKEECIQKWDYIIQSRMSEEQKQEEEKRKKEEHDKNFPELNHVTPKKKSDNHPGGGGGGNDNNKNEPNKPKQGGGNDNNKNEPNKPKQGGGNDNNKNEPNKPKQGGGNDNKQGGGKQKEKSEAQRKNEENARKKKEELEERTRQKKEEEAAKKEEEQKKKEQREAEKKANNEKGKKLFVRPRPDAQKNKYIANEIFREEIFM